MSVLWLFAPLLGLSDILHVPFSVRVVGLLSAGAFGLPAVIELLAPLGALSWEAHTTAGSPTAYPRL